MGFWNEHAVFVGRGRLTSTKRKDGSSQASKPGRLGDRETMSLAMSAMFFGNYAGSWEDKEL